MATSFNAMTEKNQEHVKLLQKQMYDLEKAHQTLETETHEKNQMDRLNKELQNLDQLKDQFLAMITHELRTPLASILGYAETIHECDLEEKEKTTSQTLLLKKQAVLPILWSKF